MPTPFQPPERVCPLVELLLTAHSMPSNTTSSSKSWRRTQNSPRESILTPYIIWPTSTVIELDLSLVSMREDSLSSYVITQPSDSWTTSPDLSSPTEDTSSTAQFNHVSTKKIKKQSNSTMNTGTNPFNNLVTSTPQIQSLL